MENLDVLSNHIDLLTKMTGQLCVWIHSHSVRMYSAQAGFLHSYIKYIVKSAIENVAKKGNEGEMQDENNVSSSPHMPASLFFTSMPSIVSLIHGSPVSVRLTSCQT